MSRGRLPVLDASGHIIGLCTRTDILRARSRQLTEEESQAGWHAAWRQRRPTTE
jgi:CBS-domain-containing membrane protein